ncbi:MAG: hypothetical protein IJK85_08595 [Bacteroidales bacterium]|nr:hypothetical protein [Bacteroidales bacterium]
MQTQTIKPQDLTWTELENIVFAVSDQIKETSAQMKETDRKLKELSTRFTTTIGNLTEGLLDPATLKLFQDAGFNVNRFFPNMWKKRKDSNVEMEIDQFMVDGDTAIAVEVKTACSKRDIDRFITKMDDFKDLFPEFASKRIFLAIAAIKYEKGSDDYAHQQGLLVVRATPDNIFSLDSSKKRQSDYVIVLRFTICGLRFALCDLFGESLRTEDQRPKNKEQRTKS